MSAAPIPKTAPFADDEIESLNRVVSTATAVQRAWLAGFLAGLDAAGAPQIQPAVGPTQAGKMAHRIRRCAKVLPDLERRPIINRK